MGLCLIIGAQPFFTYIVITAAGFSGMMLSTIFTVQILSYVQIETPAEMVGKVISTVMAVSMCAQPIGQTVYGMLFEHAVGGEWAIVLASAAISIAIAMFSQATFRGFGDRVMSAT